VQLGSGPRFPLRRRRQKGCGDGRLGPRLRARRGSGPREQGRGCGRGWRGACGAQGGLGAQLPDEHRFEGLVLRGRGTGRPREWSGVIGSTMAPSPRAPCAELWTTSMLLSFSCVTDNGRKTPDCVSRLGLWAYCWRAGRWLRRGGRGARGRGVAGHHCGAQWNKHGVLQEIGAKAQRLQETQQNNPQWVRKSASSMGAESQWVCTIARLTYLHADCAQVPSPPHRRVQRVG
jgi:hypothetical protein